jgi:hypothetical protein
MNCKFCGRALPQEKTGKRPREYCDDACKQKAYRRRHGGNPPASETRHQLQEAKLRILELERIAVKYAPPGYRKKKDVAPMRLSDMIRLHGIAHQPIEVAIAAQVLKPAEGGNLDAEGQESFWQLFNKLPGWHDCPDCPHGIIP